MKGFLIFFAVFAILYLSLNFFIGLKGWLYLFRYVPFVTPGIYWCLFAFISLSYLAGRLGREFWPERVSYLLTITGSYWLGALFYLVQVFFLLGVFRLLNGILKFIPPATLNNPRFTMTVGLTVLLLVSGILVYGTFNALRPRIVHYEVEIPKRAGSLREIRLAMASDIHLGEIIHNGRLVKLVEMINSLEPDVVVFPGDVIDEDIGPFIRQDMSSSFRRIKAKYGSYAVTGNHEFIGGHIKEAVHYMSEAGVKVLRDEYVLIADSFYLVGLDDKAHRYFAGNEPRKSLGQILEGIDFRKPVILLNHEPRGLLEAQKEGVDLQLSGHTHRGQLFPGSLITGRIYEKDWGHLQKDSLQLIVSSGFGTWGPPIRIGSRPEIVDLLIKFRD